MPTTYHTISGAATLPELAVVDALALARARGEARLLNWTADGSLIQADKVGLAWDITRQDVDRARDKGEIFSIWLNGHHWYPSGLLQLERAAVAQICRALGNLEPSSKLLFFMRKHGALGGKDVLDAIANGQIDDVLRLGAGWGRI